MHLQGSFSLNWWWWWSFPSITKNKHEKQNELLVFLSVGLFILRQLTAGDGMICMQAILFFFEFMKKNGHFLSLSRCHILPIVSFTMAFEWQCGIFKMHWEVSQPRVFFRAFEWLWWDDLITSMRLCLDELNFNWSKVIPLSLWYLTIGYSKHDPNEKNVT